MNKKCTTCNGTGRLTTEFKRKVTFKKKEFEMLQEVLSEIVDREGDVKAMKLLDKLYKPVKLDQ